MYIAFKWLVSLALTMWLAMCLIDVFLKDVAKFKHVGVNNEYTFKNKTIKSEADQDFMKTVIKIYNKSEQDMAALHVIMFLCGALAVTIFHRKHELISFMHRKIASINFRILSTHLKKSAVAVSAAIAKLLHFLRVNIEIIFLRIVCQLNSYKVSRTMKQNKIHLILLNALKKMADERKNLGQLLITAINENKNIRMQYELETLSKKRLTLQIEEIQKHLKENRTKYSSFQQLYLTTHQENSFLKTRVGKLKKEKDEAEKNLLNLINEIYKSNHKELGTYCSRFIVKTKEKVLNSDVNAEIEEFLEESHKPRKFTLDILSKQSNMSPAAKTDYMCNTVDITEVSNEEYSLVPQVSEAPKLRGLPGEYVLTVKDKDGLIEKLYECEYDSDYLSNGETMRRIRQYSVYHDKDWLLDLTKTESTLSIVTPCHSRHFIIDHSLGGYHRIVTSSRVFQNFLQSNNSNIVTSIHLDPLK